MVRIVGSGLQQKAAREDQKDAPESTHGFKIDSAYILYLPKDWACGGLSASKVQQRAMHAYNDQTYPLKTPGINHDWRMQSMSRMASLGNGIGSRRKSSKIQKGNIHRDLLKCIGNPSIPEPYIAQVPMFFSKLGTTQVRQGYV